MKTTPAPRSAVTVVTAVLVACLGLTACGETEAPPAQQQGTPARAADVAENACSAELVNERLRSIHADVVREQGYHDKLMEERLRLGREHLADRVPATVGSDPRLQHRAQ